MGIELFGLFVLVLLGTGIVADFFLFRNLKELKIPSKIKIPSLGYREVIVLLSIIILIYFLFKIITYEIFKHSTLLLLALNILYQFLILMITFNLIKRKNISLKNIGMKNVNLPLLFKRVGLFYVSIFPFLFLLAILSSLICKVLGIKPYSQVIEYLFREKNVFNLILFCIQATIFAPFVEEIIFRGVFYNAMKKKSLIRGMVLSSFIFSLLHREPFLILPVWFLGIALCFIYEKYGNLFYSIGVHFLHNALALSVVIYFKLFIHKIT